MSINKETISGTIGTLAALLGASCCILPTLLVIFGISLGSAGGFFSNLEAYRWLFLGIGYLSVGYSIYSLYLKNWIKRKIFNKPSINCACKENKLNKFSKIITWISLFLLIVATFYPYILPLIF
ncbi:mercuric ion transport protein [Deferribacter desulfuricans SSM1]|uniref:Mercuric transport protein MerT n=1 Tax=Deferribacter desulfuricans (strain DSM 14783 / JCM 11476 / NBRC 101012 / SSM1) TaxID=639282 RepID=D3PCR0_DEFDS|nr:mercuric transporter MerT family protein [Deferribacter desulfuricans]BAI80383.1 mercuric ion transport protein [Deferribacter desulfuricans SSM1]